MGGESFSFKESEEILQILTSDTIGGPIVVCGQAVNFWADSYSSKKPELKKLRPFTSRDIDVLGSLEDAAKIALSTGADLKQPPKGAPSPITANLAIKPAAGKIRLVQFLHDVPGVKRSEIIEFAVPVESPKFNIRIADPVATLRGKVYNLVTFSQDDRFDQKHFDILKLCVPIFIERQIDSAESGLINSRYAIDHLERLISISLSSEAKKLSKSQDVDWLEFVPLSRIEQPGEKRLANFHKQRFPQWIKRLSSS